LVLKRCKQHLTETALKSRCKSPLNNHPVNSIWVSQNYASSCYVDNKRTHSQTHRTHQLAG